MEKTNSKTYDNSEQNINIDQLAQLGPERTILRQENIFNPYPQTNYTPIIKVIKDHYYNEKFLFYEIGNLSFATATLLLGVSIWNGLKIKCF